MSHIQRSVDGQTIRFVQIPRIFQSLQADLPSGSIKLANGEIAYWRLQRNITDLRKVRAHTREVASRLAKALQSMVATTDFMNFYGIEEPVNLGNEGKLIAVFMHLLTTNNNRMEYSSITHGANPVLTESIIIHLGNQTILYAQRGNPAHGRQDGIKGKLYLNKGEEPFVFYIHSPVLKIEEVINERRLSEEILTKVKMNLALFAKTPSIVFEPDQFPVVEVINDKLTKLVNTHPPKANGKNKPKAKPVPAKVVPEQVDVDKDEPVEVTIDERKVGRGLNNPVLVIHDPVMIYKESTVVLNAEEPADNTPVEEVADSASLDDHLHNAPVPSDTETKPVE